MRIRILLLLVVILSVSAVGAFGQDAQASPSPTPAENEPPKPAATPDLKAISNKPVTAEQVAETVVFIYSFGSGRARLDQIRKTTIESGFTKHTGLDGRVHVLDGLKAGDRIVVYSEKELAAGGRIKVVDRLTARSP